MAEKSVLYQTFSLTCYYSSLHNKHSTHSKTLFCTLSLPLFQSKLS